MSDIAKWELGYKLIVIDWLKNLDELYWLDGRTKN